MWMVEWVNGHRFTFIGTWDGLTLVTWSLWKATHRSSEPFPGVVEYLNTHQENRAGVPGPETAQHTLEPEPEVPEWMKV